MRKEFAKDFTSSDSDKWRKVRASILEMVDSEVKGN